MLRRFISVSVNRVLNSSRSARCHGIFQQSRSKIISESSKTASKSILLTTQYSTKKVTAEIPTIKKTADALFNLDDISPFQKVMLRASKKEVTLPDFIREFIKTKKFYAAFDGQNFAAMSKTLSHIPNYKPKSKDVEPVIFFVHTDDTSFKASNPNSKVVQLRPIPIEFVVDIISSNIGNKQVSHLILDPGLPWTVVLNEENFRLIPVYFRVQRLDKMIDYLWHHSPHSLNPNLKTAAVDQKILKEAYNDVKLGPFVVCKTDEGLLILDNESTLPVWSSLDEVKEFLKSYPQYHNEEYQAYLTPNDFWNTLLKSQKHGSFIEFNPGTKSSKKFKASILQDLYDAELENKEEK